MAFRLGYAHPDLFLKQLSATQLTESLAYLWIEGGGYQKRAENIEANFKHSLGHLVIKKGS